MPSAAELRALGQYVSDQPQPGRGRQLMELLGQTWPARAATAAYDAFKHPGEVYAGRADPMDVEKATDLAGLAMTGGLGGAARNAGEAVVGAGPIRAYHGSPHDFDRFDLSKIGTGEGAQAYGHGLYFAENPAVAEAYKKLPGDWSKMTAQDIAQLFAGQAGGKESLADIAQHYGRRHPQLKEAQGLLDTVTPRQMRMYEVAIHADPERFLDWDAPLKEQAAPVKQAIERMGMGDYLNTSFKGGQIAPGPGGNLPAFVEAGLPGLKYLDQGSRSAGDGSRNYVTFSDNIVEILRKYGVGSIAALPPAVQAAIQLQQEQEAPQQ